MLGHPGEGGYHQKEGVLERRLFDSEGVEVADIREEPISWVCV